MYHPVGWRARASIAFIICGLAGVSSPARGQTAVDDFYSTPAGAALTVAAPGVLLNDPGGGLTAMLAAGPMNGTLAFNADGSFVYTPATNFTGLDAFTYQVTDGSQTSSVATVAITVLASGELFYDNFSRPAGSSDIFPWAQEFATAVAGTWGITNNLMIGSSSPTNYALAYYSSANWTDYSVQAQIRFDADNAASAGIVGRLDGNSGAHYALWVYPENSPEIYASGNGTAVLRLFKYQTWGWPYTAIGTPVTLSGIGIDWHTVKLSFQSNAVSAWFDGSPVLTVTDDGTLDGQPPYLQGGIGLNLWTLPSAAYTFSVANVIVSLSSNAVANADVYSALTNTSLLVAAPGILANDTGNGPLTALLVSNPAGGILSLTNNGGFTYTPTNGFVGTDSFTYECTDGQTTSTVATVTITVNNATLAGDDAYQVGGNSVLTVPAPGILANDTGNGPLTAMLVNGPADGTLALAADGGFIYTPMPDFSGMDSFTYECTDGQSTSSVATVSINVLPAPAAADDFYSVASGAVLNVPAPGVLFNDFSTNGSLAAVLAAGPAFGNLTLNSDGSFNYQAPTNYTGMDSFTYLATDSYGTSDVATVDVMVTLPGGLFCDNFARPTGPGSIFPWVQQSGAWSITNETLVGTSDLDSYGYAYCNNTNWTDGSVQAQVQFSSTNAWGGGIGGRLNPVTGAHYAAWIYPEGSPAPWATNGSGTNLAALQLIKFQYWTVYTMMGSAVPLPPVGTNWHTVKLVFHGTNLMVRFDGNRVTNVVDDESYDGQPAYTGGGISADMWTASPAAYALSFSNVTVNPLVFNCGYRVSENTLLTVSNPGVLGGDTDVYGTNLTVALLTGPTNGILNLNSNGGFTYCPAPGFVGTDSFMVQASDDQNVVGTSAVTISVVPVVSAPAPTILSIGLTNNAVMITWSSVANRSYRVQSSSDPTGTNWTDVLPDVPASGPTTSQTNAIGNVSWQFYRVILLSP